MNKRKEIRELPMMTPFRLKKDGEVYIKMPLFDDNGIFCNAYCIETKKSNFIMPNVKVVAVDIIMEEIP